VKKYFKKFVILVLIIALFILLKMSGLGQYLTFENLQNNKEFLSTYVTNNYFVTVLLYILIYIVVTAFSVPGATILTLAAGFLFGAIFGSVFVNIGATIGASFAFLFARYLFGTSLQEKYKEQLSKFNRELEENGYSYMLTLRLIPIFPFFLINLLAGVTNLSLRTFVWTTSIGILPGSFVYAFAGKQLNTINSVKDIFSTQILLAFVALGVFAMVPTIIKKIKKEMNYETSPPQQVRHLPCYGRFKHKNFWLP